MLLQVRELYAENSEWSRYFGMLKDFPSNFFPEDEFLYVELLADYIESNRLWYHGVLYNQSWEQVSSPWLQKMASRARLL